ncbi:MAG: DUF3667 domain-containing protein [Flavobacteriaceae bacterium]|nr:DUF3667 domain-containing protein [Flavobacteriaceae bacterium]
MNESFDNEKHRELEIHKTLDRIDGKYIWNEISSVFNFEKGIFYTFKELLVRPGKTVREFLLYDRKRIVKPIVFVIFSSLLYIVIHNILGFRTGATPDNIDNKGVQKIFEWVSENFGIVNIILGFFVGFWTKLFFRKSKFNIYEIFVLVFFVIGFGNLIFTFFGIFESVTGWDVNNFAFFTSLLYSTWAIGNFFNKKGIWNYVKGFLAFIFGVSTGTFMIILVGVLIDILNKK